MNFKNLAMWAIIVLLTVGLYNMFKNPQASFSQKNDIIFSGTPKGVNQIKRGDKLEGFIENEKILNINIIYNSKA